MNLACLGSTRVSGHRHHISSICCSRYNFIGLIHYTMCRAIHVYLPFSLQTNTLRHWCLPVPQTHESLKRRNWSTQNKSAVFVLHHQIYQHPICYEKCIHSNISFVSSTKCPFALTKVLCISKLLIGLYVFICTTELIIMYFMCILPDLHCNKWFQSNYSYYHSHYCYCTSHIQWINDGHAMAFAWPECSRTFIS